MTHYKRLLDYDPETGMREIFYGSADGESFHIETVQDPDPIRRMLTKIKSENELNRKGEMWHAGILPMATILKWKVEEGIDVFNPNHKDAVAKKLNSNEYRLLNPHEIKI